MKFQEERWVAVEWAREPTILPCNRVHEAVCCSVLSMIILSHLLMTKRGAILPPIGHQVRV